MNRKYYLAYGSNTNIEQMNRRCPNAKPVGKGWIPDYRLIYKGSKTGAYLTISQEQNNRVPVVVWSVSEQDEKNLDRYEGYPTFYYKKVMGVECEFFNSAKVHMMDAFVYIMNETFPYGIPCESYVKVCKAGYISFGLDVEYLDQALRDTRKLYHEMG